MRIEAKMATPSPAERQELLTDIGRRLDHLPIGPMHLKVVVAIGLGACAWLGRLATFIACSLAGPGDS
jgi:hypothetical protein